MQQEVKARLLTVKETAKYLSLGPSTVYHMIAEGTLPGQLRIGRKVLFDQIELDKMIEASKTGVAARAQSN